MTIVNFIRQQKGDDECTHKYLEPRFIGGLEVLYYWLVIG